MARKHDPILIFLESTTDNLSFKKKTKRIEAYLDVDQFAQSPSDGSKMGGVNLFCFDLAPALDLAGWDSKLSKSNLAGGKRTVGSL